MSVFFIILKHELLLHFYNSGRILANFLFFLISVTIFVLIAQDQENQGSTNFYFITIIWFSLLSCIIFSSAEFLKKDFEDGTIEQILHSIENFETFIMAKMIANWLAYCLPLLIFILPLGALIGLDHSLFINFFILIFLASLAVNFISTFCGSLSTLGNSTPMIAIIAMPLIIPVLLTVYSGLAEKTQTSCKILLGFSVFIGCVTVFATSKIIKIAAE
jgi:heme exporter protein CcmB